MQRLGLFRTTNTTATPETTVVPLPFIPAIVDTNDIGENGKLLPTDIIDTILKDLNAWEARRSSYCYTFNKRYSKKSIPSCKQYSILKDGNDVIYAIYKGAKHHKLLGHGANGRAKLIQNLKTGEWSVYKIQPTYNANNPISQSRHRDKKYYIDREYDHLANLKQSCLAPESRTSYTKNELQHNFAMTFARGEVILSIAQSNNPRYDIMPVTFWLRIIMEMLRAADTLHTTHRKLHRDHKPENMIYNAADRTVTIIDCGHMVTIPRNADSYSGSLAGSPIYVDYHLRHAHKKQFITDKKCMGTFTYNQKTELFSLATSIAELLKLFVTPDNANNFDPDESYIQGPGTLLFDGNIRIKNPALRLEIVNYLKQMTDHDPAKRPSIAEALAYFTTLYQQELTQQPPLEVITIRMDVWTMLTPDAQKTTIESLIKNPQVWKVCLTDSTQHSNCEYNTARRAFELAGIPVADYVLVNPVIESLNAHTQFIINQREHDPLQPIICRAHPFSTLQILTAESIQAADELCNLTAQLDQEAAATPASNTLKP